jgi:uncharacterized membrane protein
MNRFLWVLQILFGIYFFAVGVMHFIIPPGLPEAMSWMYELSDTLHIVAGTAEILAGLGLILPGVFKIKTWLTPLAALGMILVMIGAAVYHIQRGEIPNIGINLLNAAVMAFIAYGRWKLRPLEGS